MKKKKKPKPTILKTICHLQTFEMTNGDKWANPINGRQGQSFKLIPKHPEYKHVFAIDFELYVTNMDTDFMVDMKINCIVTFDVKTLVPTTHDLYEIYLHANKEANVQIKERAIKEGIMVDITAADAPFKTLEDGFKSALAIMLTYDG